jgi:hypothetical protein
MEIEVGHRELNKVVGRGHGDLAFTNREGDLAIRHAFYHLRIDLFE